MSLSADPWHAESDLNEAWASAAGGIAMDLSMEALTAKHRLPKKIHPLSPKENNLWRLYGAIQKKERYE